MKINKIIAINQSRIVFIHCSIWFVNDEIDNTICNTICNRIPNIHTTCIQVCIHAQNTFCILQISIIDLVVLKQWLLSSNLASNYAVISVWQSPEQSQRSEMFVFMRNFGLIIVVGLFLKWFLTRFRKATTLLFVSFQ